MFASVISPAGRRTRSIAASTNSSPKIAVACASSAASSLSQKSTGCSACFIASADSRTDAGVSRLRSQVPSVRTLPALTLKLPEQVGFPLLEGFRIGEMLDAFAAVWCHDHELVRIDESPRLISQQVF